MQPVTDPEATQHAAHRLPNPEERTMAVERTVQLGRPVDRTWLIAGLIVTFMIILVGGAFTVISLFNSAPPDDQQQHQTYERPITRIEFDVDSGDITLTAGEPGRVTVDRRVRWRKQEPRVDSTWDGDTLRLSSDCHGRNNCTVDYTVAVPAGVVVRAVTVDGKVSVSDLTGDLDLKNESGDINVGNSVGSVRIRSEAGNITGTGLRSPAVDVASTDGDVSLRFAAAPDTARVVLEAGAIDIAVPRAGTGVDGYGIHATTGDGERTVTVDEDSTGRHSIFAELVDGPVTVSYT
jgi:hypothetical protein